MRAAPFVFVVLFACTPVDSDGIATANMRADIQVLATGAGNSVVTAWLFSHKAGDPPLNLETIRLVDGDAISAISNGTSIAMQESDLGVEYRYDAEFATAEPHQSYAVALVRAADVGAPDSHVALPEPFTLTAPQTASRSAGLALTWSGTSSDSITITISGCASAQLGPIADVGSATFPPGSISDDPGATTCDLAVEVSRTRTGTLDPAYGQGGSVVAIQRRSATIHASRP